MLSPCVKTKQTGFTLIELLVGVAVMGILFAVAIPSFRAWLLNAQIRNAAESVQNGLQRARAEALARNTTVTFSLLPAVGNDQTSWDVNATGVVDPIDSRRSNEGSASVERNVLPPGVTTVTFGGDGTPTAGGITSISFNSTVLSAAESNDLQVNIGVGGSIRMCDPNSSSPDPRAC